MTEIECWEWQGPLNNGRTPRTSERVELLPEIWKQYVDPSYTEGNIRRACGNPRCCRPSHLFIGGSRVMMDWERREAIVAGEGYHNNSIKLAKLAENIEKKCGVFQGMNLKRVNKYV